MEEGLSVFCWEESGPVFLVCLVDSFVLTEIIIYYVDITEYNRIQPVGTRAQLWRIKVIFGVASGYVCHSVMPGHIWIT